MKNIKEDFHTYLMFFWIAMIPITLIWFKDSVLWVAIMSLYANIEASASAREANKARKESNG